jgi:hypothetical protein
MGSVLWVAAGRSFASLITVVVAAGVTMLIHAMAGHAGAVSPTPLNVAAQWVHLITVAIWIGGLAWLVLELPRSPHRRSAVKRFSLTAGIAIAAVAITGAFRAYEEVGGLGHLGSLTTTGYGWSIVTKVALFVPLVGIGAFNRYRNIDKLDQRRRVFTRAIRSEVAIGAVILVVTALLTQLAPPIDLHGLTSTGALSRSTGHDFGLTTIAHLTATPGRVGDNRFSVAIRHYATDKPIAARRVQLTFSLPGSPSLSGSTLELKRESLGEWAGESTALSTGGKWHIQALIQTASEGIQVPLSLSVASPPQRIQVSKSSDQPTVYTITMPDGSKLQTYIEPANTGINNIHFTFFTSAGKELPITSAKANATDPHGQRTPLHLRRFSAGHFVATTKLSSGSWTFEIKAKSRNNVDESGHFSQRI